MKTKGYSIKDLEILSGVKAHTIRIWEKRYQLLNPERTDTNIRYYTDNDVRKILNVSLLVKHGYKISKIAVWNDEKVRTQVLEISEKKTSDSDFIERLILFMIDFDHRGFIGLTNEIIRKLGMEDAIAKVFFNLFVRVGMYWQVGTIFPAQEHFVTHILRQKLMAEIDRLENGGKGNNTFLFFLPENELHELSLLFYSCLAQKYGFNVIYLGQSVPFDDLHKLSSRVRIDYVFAAFINSMEKKVFEKYLFDLKELFFQQKVFITGAQIQRHNPVLPRNMKVVKNYLEFKKYLL